MRAAIALAILIFSRVIGVYSPADTINGSISNAVFGSTASASTNSNLNQVLALMAGPQGPPGPAGVITNSTFTGLNGYVGKDGLPGATGAQGLPGLNGAQGPQGPAGANGEPGAGVAVIAIDPTTAPDSHCPTGGAKLVSSDGKVTYICNGIQGATGSTGATGATGPAGSGGTGSIGLGTGKVSLAACADSGKIFTTTQNSPGKHPPLYSYFNSFEVDIPATCLNAQPTTVSLVFSGTTALPCTTTESCQSEQIQCDRTAITPTNNDGASSKLDVAGYKVIFDSTQGDCRALNSTFPGWAAWHATRVSEIPTLWFLKGLIGLQINQ